MDKTATFRHPNSRSECNAQPYISHLDNHQSKHHLVCMSSTNFLTAVRCYLYAVTAVHIVVRVAHKLIAQYKASLPNTQKCLAELMCLPTSTDLYVQIILLYVQTNSINDPGNLLVSQMVIHGGIGKSDDGDILSRFTIKSRRTELNVVTAENLQLCSSPHLQVARASWLRNLIVFWS